MSRKCPHCGERKVPLLRLALLGEVSKLQCKNCSRQLEVSQFLGLLTYYVVNILMLGVLFYMIEILGVWGISLTFIIWVVAEIIRSLFLPLKVVDNKNLNQ
jgi:uncharacterized protein (DUF983 family)